MKSLALLGLLAFASTPALAADFTLTSPDVKANGTIANRFVLNSFGCTGENVSPALSWSGAPADTKSFVVTLYDPDAPTGSGFWHWTMYNIPASATGLPQGAGNNPTASSGTAGNTDFGKPGFGGPCPPQGDKPHHYVFTVFALKTEKLDLPPSTPAALLGFNVHFATLAKASFTAFYGR